MMRELPETVVVASTMSGVEVFRPPPRRYYAAAIGRHPGIYLDWRECQEQVVGFSGNLYQSFRTREEAVDYMIRNSPGWRDDRR